MCAQPSAVQRQPLCDIRASSGGSSELLVAQAIINTVPTFEFFSRNTDTAQVSSFYGELVPSFRKGTVGRVGAGSILGESCTLLWLRLLQTEGQRVAPRPPRKHEAEAVSVAVLPSGCVTMWALALLLVGAAASCLVVCVCWLHAGVGSFQWCGTPGRYSPVRCDLLLQGSCWSTKRRMAHVP